MGYQILAKDVISAKLMEKIFILFFHGWLIKMIKAITSSVAEPAIVDIT